MAAHDANDKSNPLKKPSNDLDLFDQIQDEFDALLSGAELPEVEDVQAVEQNTLTNLVLQDTTEFLSTSDMRAFDMPPGQSADVPETPEETGISDADISLAPENNASDDTTEETPANEHENSDVEIPDSIDAETNPSEDEAAPDETDTSDSPVVEPEAANKIFLSESDLSNAGDAEEKTELPPVQDKHASDLDGIDPFSDDMDDDALQEKAPVHPDMSEDNVTTRRGGGRMMMLAGVIALIVAGGIYWFTSGPQEQAEQTVSGQKQSVSKTADNQPGLSETSSVASVEIQQPQDKIQTEVTTLKKKDSAKTVTAQPAETEKAAIQRAAVEKAKAKRLAAKQAAEKRAAAKKTKAQRLAKKQAAEKRVAAEKAKAQRLAAKQAAEKRAAAEKAKAQRLAKKQAAEKRAEVEKAKAKRLTAKQAAEKRVAAEKAKAENLAAEKAAVKEVAVIQPSTQLQTLPPESPTPAAVADESGNWIIELASVNSDKSARQHMARIRSMGVESESVKINDKGRIFHSIRITGFTSKLEAMKRRDALAKLLGVRGAKVEKL